jgi:uncharacterized membrane-anchored protein
LPVIKNVTKQIPEKETYVSLRSIQSVLPYEKQIQIQYPFDRYYVEESKAPEIEETVPGSYSGIRVGWLMRWWR